MKKVDDVKVANNTEIHYLLSDIDNRLLQPKDNYIHSPDKYGQLN